jgi:hypothetical protein
VAAWNTDPADHSDHAAAPLTGFLVFKAITLNSNLTGD